jgi:hypothetical protein
MDDGTRRRRSSSGGSGRYGAHWWTTSAHWVGAAGLLCAVVLWGWQSTAGVALSLLIVASLSVAAVWGGDEDHDLRQTATVSVALGLGGTAAAGLVAALGALGVLLVVVLVLTSPQADLLGRARRLAGPPAAPPPLEHLPPRHDVPALQGALACEDLSALDDTELVLAWRHSFLQLEGAVGELDRLRVVDERQRLLDELERRFPEGVARWLASGARAQGNPQPYLDERRRGPST